MADEKPQTTPPPTTKVGQTAEAAVRAAEQAASALKAQAAAPNAGAAAMAAVESALRQDGGPAPFEPPAFQRGGGGEAPKGIDLLSDVNLNVKIELGRTRMVVEDVLKLSEGAVIELDKLAGDPVDVYVNDRPVARGEVLVLNDNFCVRINEIIAGAVDAADVETARGKAG